MTGGSGCGSSSEQLRLRLMIMIMMIAQEKTEEERMGSSGSRWRIFRSLYPRGRQRVFEASVMESVLVLVLPGSSPCLAPMILKLDHCFERQL